MGYSTRASSASGQHKKNRMIHKKKAAMTTSVVSATEQSQGIGTAPRELLFYITRERGERFLDRIIIEPQALGNGRGYLRIQPHVGIVRFRMKNTPQRMNHSERAAFRQRQSN